MLLCDGRSDKGKIRKKAPVLHPAMTRIKREVRRNPLGCSKDVLENADVPVQINSIPYPEDLCKMWKARGSPSIKAYPQERKRTEWAKNLMQVNFQTVLFIDECRPTLDGPNESRRRWYCNNQEPRWGPRPTGSGISKEVVV